MIENNYKKINAKSLPTKNRTAGKIKSKSISIL
jgi:hypothetical protein